MNFTLLQTLLDSDESNYKCSGLPKFIKYKSTILTKEVSNKSPRCILSIEELHDTLIEHYGTVSMDNIIRLYIDHDIMVSSSITINLPINEIHKYREYDRSRSIYCSRRTPSEFDELFEDIKVNGMLCGGRIRIERINEYEIEVLLGEGNHRLAIATQLEFDNMPITFRYVI